MSTTKNRVYQQSTIFFITILLFSIYLSSCDLSSNNRKKYSKEGWSEYSVNSKGDSIMILYGSDGVKKSEVTFKNGLYDGIGYNYYKNGKLKNEIHYKKGKKDGEVKWFYDTGKLYRLTLYKMGKKDGIRKKYYRNGKLKAEIPYKNNELQFGLKEYKKDGSLYTNYPKIHFKEIDKLAFENKIILRIYLKPKGRKTEYFMISKVDGDEHEFSLSGQTKNGVAELSYFVKPGDLRMKKLKFKVVTNTRFGNPLVMYKSYNLAIENRLN